jgi:MinD-like ATPase involved in chromosome partitioning or flagellar assembly
VADKIPTFRIDLPARQHEAPEDEQLIAIPDEPVSADTVDNAGTITIDIIPAQALAAGKAYEAQAALEAAEAVAELPPLPVEPKPLSRHGRRWKPAREDQTFRSSRPETAREHPLPEGAWPEIVYGLTMTLVNLGDSRSVRARKRLEARIARPVEDGAGVVPVISRQGGVGATTVTALLGMALADVRDDQVLALDAHPDRGLLSERIAHHLTDLEVRTLHTPRALEHAVEDADADYSVVLTDGATGVADSAVRVALKHAGTIVLVSGGTSEQARIASETVDWLTEHDMGNLAANAVVALNTSTPGTRYESLDAIEAHFQSRVRDVVRIPFDEELVAGAPVRYGALRPDTRDAARDLAALVVDGLAISADPESRAA